MRASRSIIDNKNYIKKVPFPSEIFPIFITLSEFVNLFIGLGIYLILFLILKGMPTIYILILPLAIILQLVFTLSLAFFLSSGAVYFPGYSHYAGSFVHDMVLGDSHRLHDKSDPGEFPMDSPIESGLLYDRNIS